MLNVYVDPGVTSGRVRSVLGELHRSARGRRWFGNLIAYGFSQHRL